MSSFETRLRNASIAVAQRCRRAPWTAVLAAGLLLAAPWARTESAIGFVKLVGTRGTRGNGSTLSVTVPAAGVAVGNTVIVSFAIEPETGAVTCTDTRGNTYSCADANVQNGVSGSGTAARTVVCSAYVTQAPNVYSPTTSSGNCLIIVITVS